MPDAPAHSVRSREHLLHLLAEAAELEHNLLCSYLYAAFGLKQGLDEGVEPHELEAIGRWRGAIMGVCIEEMGHLAQVANLMVAVGSRPHFDRPNLPVAPGYHPAGIQIALLPFDMETLEHFIFLERPESAPAEDPASIHEAAPKREIRERRPETGVLMPSAPDYATIGEFYDLLSRGMSALADEIGADRLFIGPADCQLRPEEIGVDDLSVVTDLASAQRALHLIVVQGEGAGSGAAGGPSSERSHFEQFLQIQREYEALRAARPEFHPSRDVARNPVMRRPLADDRLHVSDPAAAPILDAANAVYSAMLRCLVAVYDTPQNDAGNDGRRAALLAGAFGAMKVLRQLSDVLTTLPANADAAARAGVTFAMLRSTEGLAPGVDVVQILAQRFERIRKQLPQLALPEATARGAKEQVDTILAALG